MSPVGTAQMGRAGAWGHNTHLSFSLPPSILWITELIQNLLPFPELWKQGTTALSSGLATALPRRQWLLWGQ